jgi:hypothetical protein
MGLAQIIQFQYPNTAKLEKFISEFCRDFNLKKEGNMFIISSLNGDDYKIELAIENYGLYIHRSGNYFEIFGQLIEAISGKFGKTIIEDE